MTRTRCQVQFHIRFRVIDHHRPVQTQVTVVGHHHRARLGKAQLFDPAQHVVLIARAVMRFVEPGHRRIQLPSLEWR